MGYVRKYLSTGGLLEIIWHNLLLDKKFPKCEKSRISWQDCIMAGLAIFNLKFPSLLQFENAKDEPFIARNLRKLFHIKDVPSDTCLRERLDKLPPEKLRPLFKKIFAHLQRGKVLDGYKYLDESFLISIDATGQYSSEKVSCKNCCVKKHSDGRVTYYHQMLGAVIIHPDQKVVIPLAPEPIIRSDGNTKNDCERNAAKRLLTDFRREHPYLKAIVVEDGLGSNYPHLTLLDSLKLPYIIGVKEGDHAFLFDWVRNAKAKEHAIVRDKIIHKFRFVSDVPLSDEHSDYRVNVLEYWEEKPNGKKQHFAWVTKMPINEQNMFQIMRAGRARWRIENETFNTLKNQGYHFEHNYGHGNEYLCSVMTMLMLLAFLIDQVQELCCSLYKKVRQKFIKTQLFERMRVFFSCAVWESWHDMFESILSPLTKPPPFGLLPQE
jgi:hypothetical protein